MSISYLSDNLFENLLLNWVGVYRVSTPKTQIWVFIKGGGEVFGMNSTVLNFLKVILELFRKCNTVFASDGTLFKQVFPVLHKFLCIYSMKVSKWGNLVLKSVQPCKALFFSSIKALFLFVFSTLKIEKWFWKWIFLVKNWNLRGSKSVNSSNLYAG